MRFKMPYKRYESSAMESTSKLDMVERIDKLAQVIKEMKH
jgi:hypothetical protein